MPNPKNKLILFFLLLLPVTVNADIHINFTMTEDRKEVEVDLYAKDNQYKFQMDEYSILQSGNQQYLIMEDSRMYLESSVSALSMWGINGAGQFDYFSANMSTKSFTATGKTETIAGYVCTEYAQDYRSYHDFYLYFCDDEELVSNLTALKSAASKTGFTYLSFLSILDDAGVMMGMSKNGRFTFKIESITETVEDRVFDLRGYTSMSSFGSGGAQWWNYDFK